ncbi:conjugative transposon protein TraN [Rhizosphaericola mali]|uniref:Conjugative transposon protein TraN n=1 Tax=Rhizosphaericola mali TaxID=2545455 RepID=A0A5P2G456_9BACT|nr:conjugative transposon protein TraN [Rhizosphaericola mali]QES88929.1 conjugative transposon protein TraN [Rhizosphaericola mali]
MKQILTIVFMVLLVNNLFAQQANLDKITSEAYGRQYPLFVGVNETTILIFPCKIAAGGVDIGSTELIASTITSVDNILRIKAATENMAPTNLTVVTTDGKIYSFYTRFSPYPDNRPIDLGKQINTENAQIKLKGRKIHDGQIQQYADSIINLKTFLKQNKIQSFGVQFSLKGIYTKEDVLFFRLDLKNKSPLNFTADFMRFYIRDQKRLKRTADQEQELQPLRIFPENTISVNARNVQTIIVAFKRFTIADHKNMVIQIFEKNGDRHLQLKIKGKVLMQTSKL